MTSKAKFKERAPAWLLKQASAIGRSGSDANLTTHVGVPTIDGLGPIGDGAHTQAEYIWLPSLRQRANITAIGLSRLLASPPLEMLARARVRRPTASGER